MSKPDPIVSALAGLEKNRGGGKRLLPQVCTPEQLEAVKAARGRGVSCQAIADALTAGGVKVSEGAVVNWLKDQGIR